MIDYCNCRFTSLSAKFDLVWNTPRNDSSYKNHYASGGEVAYGEATCDEIIFKNDCRTCYGCLDFIRIQIMPLCNNAIGAQVWVD
eukprot:c10130_g1_i2 orf=157-411(+)